MVTSSCHLYPAPGQVQALLLLGHKEVQATFPASLGELPRASGRGGRLRAEQQGSPHLSSHSHPQDTARGSGLETCDTDAEARAAPAGWVAPGTSTGTQGVQPGIYPQDVPEEEQLRATGRAAVPIGRDSCRETGLPRPGFRDARAGQAAVSLRARRALPPPPAARNAPLTQRPAARRRRQPCAGPPGRPPRGLADKARTAARTPRPEVGPRPRPGNFRRRSRRPGARGPLGAWGFRPGAGRARRQGAAERWIAARPRVCGGPSASAPWHLRAWPVPQSHRFRAVRFPGSVMPTLEPGGAQGAAAGGRQASPRRHRPRSVAGCLQDR